MLLQTLKLENFGTYAGINEIDLRPEDDKPIVLIGGTNGAGKTTILEGILVCLQGKRAFGSAVNGRKYQELILSRFHVPAEGAWRPSECAVTLEFETAESGDTSQFEVIRRWRRTGGGAVREFLELRRDGELVDDLPESAWQHFLDGLVPPGVAGLFFFDGERIQALAEDESGAQLRDAVRRLLGLDLIEQLQRDLGRFVMSKADAAPPAVEAEAARCAELVQLARAKNEELREQRAMLLARREELATVALQTHEAFARRGGALALERQDLERQHRAASESAAGLGAQARELVVGLLPFALCPSISRRVAIRIESEAAAEEAAVVRRRLSARSGHLEHALSIPAAEAITLLTEAMGVNAPDGEEQVHDLTPNERAVLGEQLRRLDDEVRPRAQSLANELRAAEESRTRTKELLATVPDESDVADLIIEVQSQERGLASIELEIEKLDEELQHALYELKVAERERKLAADAVRSAAATSSRVGRAIRVGAVLADFEERSLEQKLGQVEVEAARFFNRLSRKGSLLSRVEIDRESFRVDLRRWDDVDLPRERLSAGERQLLAISLIWALAKISGRPLPVVIDTPLARLDREHRVRLLQEYLPSVSHQVVVLSTDTEIDSSAAMALEPFVSRAYQLVHDSSLCQTEIRDGYFVDDAEVTDAR